MRRKLNLIRRGVFLILFGSAVVVVASADGDTERVDFLIKQLGEASGQKAQAWVEEAEVLRASMSEVGAEGLRRGKLAVELSWVYRETARFDLAEARASEAADLGARLNDAVLQADGLNALGGVYWRRGDLARVWELWLRALRLREDAGDQVGVAACYSNLGILLDSEGDYPGALEYYQRALQIDREIGSRPAEIASTLNNIGALHEQMLDPAAALVYHREALAIRETVGDDREIAISHNNIGASLVDLGELDEGREALLHALTLRRNIEDRAGEASTLGELGKLERLAGHLELARSHAEAGLRLYVEIEEPWGEADVANQLGEIALARGDTATALIYFEQARRQAEKVGGPVLLADQWDGRARALEVEGRWREALTALRNHAALREQIAGDASKRRVELLEIRYETQRRELELVRLRTANERAEQALLRIQFERRAIIAGTIALALFVAGLALAYRWQRRATDAARIAHDRVQTLSTRKDQFLRIVAHDLRSPLGNLRWMAGLLRQAPERPDEVKKIAGMMDDIAARLVETTDNLLDLDRIEAGAIKPEWQDVDVPTAVGAVVDQRRVGAAAKNQTLACTTHLPAGHRSLRTDGRLLQQVVDNLISNAIKFTPDGGKIAVLSAAVEGGVEISVSDSGPGISAEARGNVFTPFARIGNSPTAGEETHGLGLAIARGLVEPLGGRLQLSSKSSCWGGACFELWLPPAPASDADQAMANGEVGQ